MNLKMDYGRHGLTLTLLDDTDVFLTRDAMPLADEIAAIRDSLLTEVRFTAFGEIRYESGDTTTDKLYTGQRQEYEIGLDHYVARWYDPG